VGKHRVPRSNAVGLGATLVYFRHMSRGNVEIEDEACEIVMRMYRLQARRDAMNLALRKR
jgi:Arc/MetJ family transcription regulator